MADRPVSTQARTVARLAAYRAMGRVPASVELGDLFSVALFAAWEAEGRYNPDQGPLESYIYQRAQGAIQDLLRDLDHISRGSRKKLASLEAAEHACRQYLGRAPGRRELCEYLGVSYTELESLKLLTEFKAAPDEPQEWDLQWDPIAEHSSRLDAEKVTMMVLSESTEAEKVVCLGLLEGRTLADSAALLGVTESRACQIASNLCTKLLLAHQREAQPKKLFSCAADKAPVEDYSGYRAASAETYRRLEVALGAQT